MIDFKPRPLLYLSAPYSHDDPDVVRVRIESFCSLAAEIESAGQYHAVSALFNQLLLDRGFQLPSSWEYWKSYSLSLLRVCSVIWVLKMPGWDKSSGVRGEIEMAEYLKIPISYITPRGPYDPLMG